MDVAIYLHPDTIPFPAFLSRKEMASSNLFLRSHCAIPSTTMSDFHLGHAPSTPRFRIAHVLVVTFLAEEVHVAAEHKHEKGTRCRECR